MLIKNLIPQIFYDHIADGLDFFVDGLGCTLLHRDGGFAIVAREGAKAYLIESAEFAAKDRP